MSNDICLPVQYLMGKHSATARANLRRLIGVKLDFDTSILERAFLVGVDATKQIIDNKTIKFTIAKGAAIQSLRCYTAGIKKGHFNNLIIRVKGCKEDIDTLLGSTQVPYSIQPYLWQWSNISYSKGTNNDGRGCLVRIERTNDTTYYSYLDSTDVIASYDLNFTINTTEALVDDLTLTVQWLPAFYFDEKHNQMNTREDLVWLFNTQLPTLPSGTTRVLTIGSDLLDKLTEEDKKIATDKGWTLA